MLQEQTFESPVEMAAKARGSLDTYRALAEAATTDPEAFWGDAARKELHWSSRFHTVLDWASPFARWFEGGPPTFHSIALIASHWPWLIKQP